MRANQLSFHSIQTNFWSAIHVCALLQPLRHTYVVFIQNCESTSCIAMEYRTKACYLQDGPGTVVLTRGLVVTQIIS
jgi:hypothetical protein